LPVGDVVVDLAGMEIPASIPLLSDHENARGSIIGQATASHDGKALTASGFLTAATAAGQELIALAKDGIRFQASIGAKGTEFERVRPGETVDVNGQQLQSSSPLRVARKSVLREISIVAIGVDVGTSVDIAAKAKGQTMADTTTATKTEDEIKLEERARLTSIEASCKAPANGWGEQQTQVDDLRAKAVNDDITQESLSGSLLAIMREARPSAPAGHSGTRDVTGSDVLEAKMLIRCGMASLAEKEFGEAVCDRADRIHANSLPEILGEAMRLGGVDIAGMKSAEMIRASFGGFSGGEVPNLMSNVLGRALLGAYSESPATWKSFATIRQATNFKNHQSIRPTFVGELAELPRGGTIDHASVEESSFSWSVDRFARMLRVDEQDLIDDDLNFLQETAPAFGRAAMRSLSDNVWGTILSNSGSFFSSGNSNLESGGSSALDGTSLDVVLTAFRSRRDSNDLDLDIKPLILAVPPELDKTARELLQSVELSKTATADGTPIGNALQNALGLEVESRLSNTARFSNGSTTGWFVFAGPADAAVIVAFLNSQQTPRLRFFGTDHTVDQIGVAWTIDFDYGSALGDPLAAHKSNGV
jgi:hypothetical protein